MIDYQARQRLYEAKKQDRLADSIRNAFVDGVKAQNANKVQEAEVLKFVVKREEDEKLQGTVDRIGQAIAMVYKAINKPLPKIFQVQGKVKADIESMPNLKITNLSDLQPYFSALEKRLAQMATAISMIAATPPPTPKDIKIPEFNIKPLIEAIDRIPGGSSNADVVDKLADIERGIAALYDKPQMTPQPATNMSINALGGSFHATTLNVGTSATALPLTAISNRRSLIIYNNSSNIVYLGDSNVAASGTGQGLPIPANSYSPSFQAGSTMTVYGIAGSTSSVTILEMSDNTIGR